MELINYDINQSLTFFFDQYLAEDGRKRAKHVGGTPHDCISLYLITVQVLVYVYIYIYAKCSVSCKRILLRTEF